MDPYGNDNNVYVPDHRPVDADQHLQMDSGSIDSVADYDEADDVDDLLEADFLGDLFLEHLEEADSLWGGGYLETMRKLG